MRDHKKDAQEALNKIKKTTELVPLQNLHTLALIEAVKEVTKEYNLNLVSNLSDQEIHKELIKRGWIYGETHEAWTYTKLKKGFN